MKAIAIAVALTGCVTEDELELTETEQDLSWMTWVVYGTSDGSELDMGPTSDRTCFLTGIRGSLSDSEAGAFRVWDAARGQERWKVRTKTSATALGVRVMVGCIRAVEGRVQLRVSASHDDRNPSTKIDDRPTRQCFLQNLRTESSDGFVSARLERYPDWQTDRMEWSLYLANTSGQTTATAVCVDVPSSAGPTRVAPPTTEYNDYSASGGGPTAS